MSTSAQREMLQIADALAREKGIESEEVVSAMEEALQRVAKAKYGQENDIRVVINRQTGEVKTSRFIEVCDLVEDPIKQVNLEDGMKLKEDVTVGEFIIEDLPPVEFGRVSAQSARQIISQRVRHAARERQYQEFIEKVGGVTSGIIRRVEFGNYIIDINRAEAILRRDEVLPREMFKVGDRIRALIMDVRKETRGPQIFLSRTHPQFMARLFEQEVPEIYDGVIEIIAVARDPGSRAKIAVYSKDGTIDPVGACVGMRGSRVQAVVNELQGEKVDIVNWSDDLATFIINAQAPAEISKVVIDMENNKVEVVVPDDQLSLAIGRRGQNVRLASILTKMEISITTEAQESEKRAEEFKERSKAFIEALDVDDVISHLLTAEGYGRIEDLAAASIEDLTEIEGFDEEIAEEILKRANDFLKSQEEALQVKISELGIKEDLIKFEGFTSSMLLKLADDDVKSLEDFAGLANDEFVELVGNQVLTEDEASEMIMRARVQLGWIEVENNEEVPNEDISEESEIEPNLS